MSTPAQQLRIDRLTREALGNPDYERLRLRTLALTVAISCVALGAVAASMALQVPHPSEAAHRFTAIAPSGNAENGAVVDLTY